MTYKLLVADSANALEEVVNGHLSEGWMLKGGVAVSESNFYSEDHRGDTKYNFHCFFAQAMTFVKPLEINITTGYPSLPPT